MVESEIFLTFQLTFCLNHGDSKKVDEPSEVILLLKIYKLHNKNLPEANMFLGISIILYFILQYSVIILA